MNKFIGGRYIPLHDGEHDSSKEYAPLTVVTKNGNSYTSKTYIPAGITLDNEKYWALTGEYNAQVASLNQHISNIKNDIKNLTNYVTPQMFGAKGDGVSDDSDAFISAFATGKDVYLPECSYMIEKHVEVTKTNKISGADGAIIIVKTNETPSSLSGSNGLCFNGNTNLLIDYFSYFGKCS